MTNQNPRNSKGTPQCADAPFVFSEIYTLLLLSIKQSAMPNLFGKDHLRVETPQTTDGLNLKYDADGKPVTRITFLPLTARNSLEANNAKLPQHLRKKITVVPGDNTAAEPKKTAKQKS